MPLDLLPDLPTLEARYADARDAGLSLDLTRGKPGSDQLDLSDAMDGILGGDHHDAEGTDLRNYGGLEGIPAAKRLGADLLEVPAEAVLVGGNASLELMFHAMLLGWQFGWRGPDSAWSRRAAPKVLCPVPGYDRHFSITERLGIEMVPVPLGEDGPDMDLVESLITTDPDVVAMWCNPKYANPTGVTYAPSVVDRIAVLGRAAGPDFKVIWDNAYAVHDLGPVPSPLASLWVACEAAGTTESVIHIASTSKITLAGSGLAFLAAGPDTLAALRRHLAVVTIGPDKVNQERHVRLLPDRPAVAAHMAAHAALVRPKFAATLGALEEGLAGQARWTTPQGGYFVSLWTDPGLAATVVDLAAAVGVRLTPAGAAFPYGRDPDDSHIRLAPTFPSLGEVEAAMDVVVLCVQLATARRALDDGR